MMNVLVLGGTGFVGAHVCEKLVRLGARVTVPTRRPDRAVSIRPLPGVHTVVADVHDEATLTRLLAGQDAVVNLVAILHGTAAAFERTHVALPRTLARACAAAGVRRVVHVSALGADPAGPSRYQRSKAGGEAVLQVAAATHGLDLTVLRPGVIFGPGDRFLNLFAALQRVLPVMLLAGADTRMQPVWVGDVAEAVVRVLRTREAIGQTFELAGPEVYTLRELVQLAGREAGIRGGRGRPVIGLPLGLGRLQAAMLALLPGEPLMSADNVDSLRVDNVATGQLPGLAALGLRPASLRGIAPQYLGARGPRSRLDALRARAGR